MRKSLSVFRRAGLILASVLVLFSAVSFTGCSNGSDDDINNALITIVNTRLARIQGKWVSSYSEGYEVTATEFKNSYSGSRNYEGNNLFVDFTDNSSGYIYFKYTRSMLPDYTYSEDASDVGKWYAVHFKDLYEDGTCVKFSGAYKTGGKSSCETLAEAKKEFTVENGYYAIYSTCEKQK